VKLINLDKGDKVIDVARVVSDKETNGLDKNEPINGEADSSEEDSDNAKE
jgi:hypothetical protein